MGEGLGALPGSESHSSTDFISTFCRANDFQDGSIFSNELRGFTPCFTDVFVLGACRVMLIVLCFVRLGDLRCGKLRHFQLLGVSKQAHEVAIAAAAMLAAIPVLQFNARLAQATYALASHQIAPYEITGFVLSIAAWGLVVYVLVRELNAYTPTRAWAMRMPVVALFAAEVAKTRIVLELTSSKDRTYFFWLFIVYAALQGAAALAALFWYPNLSACHRAACEAGPDGSYEVLMSSEEEHAPVCPEATANIFSRLTFSWLGPILVAGYKAPLEFRDLWQLPEDDTVEVVTQRFEKFWRQELQKEEPRLMRASMKLCAPLFIQALPFKLGNDASQFVGPLFLNLLLTAIAAGVPAQRCYLYALAMFCGLSGGTLSDGQHWQRVMRAGFRLRAVLIAQVYRKVLSLSASARTDFSRGYIYNLATSDVDSLQQFCNQVFGLMSAPLRIIVAMALLYQQLGVSSLAALAVLVTLIPCQTYMVKLSMKILKSSMAHSDNRTKLESDMVTGIEAVKTAAWEEPFLERILRVRHTELAILWTGFKVAAVNSLILQTVPTLVTMSTFALYVLLGNTLTAANAFSALALFSVLRFPLFQLPSILNQLTSASVAMNRLQEFLSAEEQPALPLLPSASHMGNAVAAKGSFCWSPDLPPVLRDLCFVAKCGELVVIVGGTGSGKSSLLQIALGLAQGLPGSETLVRGQAAYVAQSAFISGGTVRDNILFESPYNEDAYWAAVEAASLLDDFQQLPAGDMTELGESGINVSGGQKQRIQLARAVYSGADVYLMDDPLSALDAKVGRQVFEKCINGKLVGFTRLLVTNQLQYARHADRIVYLAGGTIQENGTYSELMASGGAFASMMAEAQIEEDDDSDAADEAEGAPPPPVSEPALVRAASSVLPAGPAARPAALDATSEEPDGRLTESEGRAKGVVSGSVLAAYMNAMGGVRAFGTLIAMYLLVEALRVSATVWLSVWTSDTRPWRASSHGAMWYLSVFAAISVTQVLVAAINQYRMRSLSVTAAESLHAGMLRCLLRAPMSFFHINPSGRIINRLTKDTSEIDRNLAQWAAMWFQSLLQLLSTAAVIGIVTPFVLPILVPVLLMFYMLYAYFQSSVREVKRLDALSRSPIFTTVSDAINGLATIRCFRREAPLIGINSNLVDRNSVMNLTNQSMNRWLAVRLDGLGACVALAAAVLAIQQKGHAAWTGLTLSYALQMTQLTGMTVRVASIAENSFNSVERVDEYSHVEPEAPAYLEHPDQPRITRGWPSAGEIVFQKASMRYRAGLPLVLKSLSFTITAGTKVGVVGRTGAGKSSIINALFRLQELNSGSIHVDGVDISTLGLAQVRGSMALIPQVPVMFTGSLRDNLSPFGTHTDGQLWEALERAHLAPFVRGRPEGLDLHLAEGGAPMSAGQRQLVALARALLRQARVLVLDEATANVDVETDALIQNTIRTEFAGCTVVAIAHRLQTIIDCDAVLVMAAGAAAEFGSPAALLDDRQGVFSSMVADTGEATERFLRSVAAGEVSIAAHRQGDAEAGRAAVQAAPPVDAEPDVVALTQAVMRDAKQAADIMSHLLAYLRDQERTKRLEAAHGAIDHDAPFAYPHATPPVLDALKEAASVLTSLRTLTMDAHNRIAHSSATAHTPPSLTLPPPAPLPSHPQTCSTAASPSRPRTISRSLTTPTARAAGGGRASTDAAAAVSSVGRAPEWLQSAPGEAPAGVLRGQRLSSHDAWGAVRASMRRCDDDSREDAKQEDEMERASDLGHWNV